LASHDGGDHAEYDKRRDQERLNAPLAHLPRARAR